MGWEQALAAFVLVAFAVGALGAVCAREDRRLLHQERQAEIRASVQRAAYQPQYPMLHTLNTPYTEVERKALPIPILPDVPAPQLPGPMTLGQVQAGGWRPSRESILLGMGPDGALITVPVGDLLCHVVTAGKTGSGKSNTLRLLLTQLAAVGAEYYICDPHFAPVHPRTGEDWRALAAASQPRRALTDKAEIVALVDGLAAEVEARLARWHIGRDPGPARFYLFEELPSLADADKDFMRKLGRLLREGRKLGLFVITAAQDMLISTVGGSAGLRSQFATVYYGGGDPYTARALLAVKVVEPPGKGICWLKSVTDTEPRQVRVPLVENADIERLLGTVSPVSGPVSPVSPARFTVLRPETENSVLEAVPETGRIDPAKREAVRAALQTDETYTDIVKRIWAVKPGGGPGWVAAGQEMRAIIADLTKGA